MPNKINHDRRNILTVITSPLGFFALSLLIVEGFLTIVLVLSGEQGERFKFWGMIIGALLFLVVVIPVYILVWKRPANLTLEGKDYSEFIKNRISFSPEAKNLTTNEDIEEYIEEYD